MNDIKEIGKSRSNNCLDSFELLDHFLGTWQRLGAELIQMCKPREVIHGSMIDGDASVLSSLNISKYDSRVPFMRIAASCLCRLNYCVSRSEYLGMYGDQGRRSLCVCL